MLTIARIESLVAALRSQHAPVVDRLAPGLSDAEMDEMTAPLGIRLATEARTWWGYANGAPAHEGDPYGAVLLTSTWWWAPLEAIVAECLRLRETSDPSLWLPSWLPVVIGDGELVIDTAVPLGEPSPVHVIDFEADELVGPDHLPTLPSLGALIEGWTDALNGAAVQYQSTTDGFAIDWGCADALGVPDGVL